jgi:LuxR family transcriptional regulator, maltose regulon positive regulatory protein
VVTVYGGAGSGKTTAVALAVRDLDRAVAWLSLDDTEAAAGRLLGYVEAAFAKHVPAATGVASKALAEGIPAAEAAALLAESLESSRLLFVCDNVERVGAGADAVGVLSALVRYVPQGVGLAS